MPLMSWTIIKSEKEYQKALSRLEEIFDATPKDTTFGEAELLTLLIEKYESETVGEFVDPDPIEFIKFKMEQQNLKNKDLALIVGSKSMASELLNRKRRLTLGMIRKINKALAIPADILIKDYELAS